MRTAARAICAAWQCLLCGHWTSLPVCPCSTVTARKAVAL